MTDKEKLLDIRNQINEHFSQDEPAPDPEPQPDPNANYSIEIDTKHSIESGRTFPAGTKINYIVTVKKDGEGAWGVPVIFEFPDAPKTVVSKKNGHTPVHGYPLPEGGLNMRVYLENHPGVSLRWITHATGSYTPPSEEPEQPPSNPPSGDKDYANNPNGNGTKVLIMNLNAPGIDVKLNGKWFKLEGHKSAKMQGKDFTGRIINLHGNLNNLELDPEQIRVDGLNLFGFGKFYYKIMNKHPDSNLTAPYWYGDSEGINYWGKPYPDQPFAFIKSAGGHNTTVNPDPDFYKLSVPEHFNNTGKIAIFFSGYGKNHPAFKPVGDRDW